MGNLVYENSPELADGFHYAGREDVVPLVALLEEGDDGAAIAATVVLQPTPPPPVRRVKRGRVAVAQHFAVRRLLLQQRLLVVQQRLVLEIGPLLDGVDVQVAVEV